MAPLVEIFSDTRAVLGTAVAMFGFAFIRYGVGRHTPAIAWLALSSMLYGLGQLTIRLIEMTLEVGNPLNGWLGVGVGLPALAGFMAGTTALLMRGQTGWFAFLATVVGLPAVFFTWRWLQGPIPFQWQFLVAGLFTGMAVWALVGNRDISRFGRFGLAIVLLLYPAALLYSVIASLPIYDFRRLSIVAISLKFFYLMTLILQHDAKLLLRELRSRVEAQSALQQLTDTLEDKVQERTRQLQAVNQGLRSFAGMVSHDLRSPVRNIGGLARVARESLADNDPQGASQAVNRIESEAMRASDMTTDLLALATAEQGVTRLDWVDMQALTINVIDQLALQYPGARETITAQGLPSVRADRDLMAHVLTNLLSNALKFGAQVPGLQINVGAQSTDAHWRFAVSDNGPGIDPAMADQLFKPFSRLGQHKVPGTGLGLTVVQRVVQAHGGDVGADVPPQGGASFWWTLPVEPKAAATQ
jgi:signal transduction histidine kinase